MALLQLKMPCLPSTQASTPFVTLSGPQIHVPLHRRQRPAAVLHCASASTQSRSQPAANSHGWAAPPCSCRRIPHTSKVHVKWSTVRTRSSALEAQSQQQQQQQQPAQQQEQQPIQQQGWDMLYMSLDGSTIWRVRPYKEADFNALVQIQTDAFHQPPPPALKALHQVSYVNFRAEVLDSIKKKAKAIDGENYQLYVAVDVTKALFSMQPTDANASTSLSRALPAWWQPTNTHAFNSISSSTCTSSSSSSSSGNGSSSSEQLCMVTPDSVREQLTGPVVGVVEVTQMDEDQSVLQQLPKGTPFYGYMSSMAVAAHVRRRGLAQALLHIVQTQSARWSQQHLTLHVYDDNTPAVQLYRKYGFKQLGQDPSWRKLLGGRVRLLMYMTVPIPPAMEQQQQEQEQEQQQQHEANTAPAL